MQRKSEKEEQSGRTSTAWLKDRPCGCGLAVMSEPGARRARRTESAGTEPRPRGVFAAETEPRGAGAERGSWRELVLEEAESTSAAPHPPNTSSK